MEQDKQINMQLLSVRETAVRNSCGGKDLSNLKPENLFFQFKTHVKINRAKDTITVLTGAKYSYNGQELLLVESDTVFKVEQLDEIVTQDPDKNEINFSFDIIPVLLSISYGTLRGIVYKETQKGPLESYPMPMIPTKVLTEKSYIAIEE